ncbi:MAG: helix-turn-helix transcriptional regulator [Nocardioidaceae bacterium]
MDELRREVGFDAYAWLITDPRTGVGCDPLADVPCMHELHTLIKFKYLTPVNRWTTLAGLPTKVGLLRGDVADELSVSLVWREVQSRYAVHDVASVVFSDRHGSWGFLDLWRDRGVAFDAADGAFLASLVVPLTAALRRCQASTFTVTAVSHRRDLGPVVLVLDDDLAVVSQTAASKSWLEMLIPPVQGAPVIPASVYNVAAQLLALEAGVDDNEPSARVHLADGYWVTLRAARLSKAGDEPGRVAVTIEEMSPADRLDVFSRSFDLTPRETELLAILATGIDTREVAQRVFLSEHTVQDHLKSIFAKTATHSRRTLLARALGTRPH